MSNLNITIKYSRYLNSISFLPKIGCYFIGDFSAAVNLMQAHNRDKKRVVVLDFSMVIHCYSTGMLPIIATVNRLFNQGYQFEIQMPGNPSLASLFIRTNWAHFLCPDHYPLVMGVEKHLHTRNFKNNEDINRLTLDFMDLILRTMVVPKDIISGLEWSIYEICDNVINHANTPFGGFIESIIFPKEARVGFTIADGGNGILNSMIGQFPGLIKSTDAIERALEFGVTGTGEKGRGNGMAGTKQITVMSGGSIDIISGAGRLYVTPGGLVKKEQGPDFFFQGTNVSGGILMNKEFSIGKAIFVYGKAAQPDDLIVFSHEDPDEDAYVLKIKNEATGVGTRVAGKQMYTKVINLLSKNPDYGLRIDWSGIEVISHSFADEFIARLYDLKGKLWFDQHVKHLHIAPLVTKLLSYAIVLRKEVKITGSMINADMN